MTGPTDTPVAAAPAVIDGVNVDAVAAAVRACAGVADLYAGRFGEIGSYLPGRRVAGVQVGPDTVTVQVRSRWAVPASDLLHQITAVTASVIGSRWVTVIVADIDDPPADTAVQAPLALPAPTPPAAPVTVTVPASQGPDPVPGLVDNPLRPGSVPPPPSSPPTT